MSQSRAEGYCRRFCLQYARAVSVWSCMSSNVSPPDTYKFEGLEKATRGREWMGVNQNSSTELDLCPKIDWHTSLLTRSRLLCYRQATCPWNRVRKFQITAETRIDPGKYTCETMASKIVPKISSSPHIYFTEHLTGVFEKPPHESD
jgi:hypothetical protein